MTQRFPRKSLRSDPKPSSRQMWTCHSSMPDSTTTPTTHHSTQGSHTLTPPATHPQTHLRPGTTTWALHMRTPLTSQEITSLPLPLTPTMTPTILAIMRCTPPLLLSPTTTMTSTMGMAATTRTTTGATTRTGATMKSSTTWTPWIITGHTTGSSLTMTPSTASTGRTTTPLPPMRPTTGMIPTSSTGTLVRTSNRIPTMPRTTMATTTPSMRRRNMTRHTGITSSPQARPTMTTTRTTTTGRMSIMTPGTMATCRQGLTAVMTPRALTGVMVMSTRTLGGTPAATITDMVHMAGSRINTPRMCTRTAGAGHPARGPHARTPPCCPSMADRTPTSSTNSSSTNSSSRAGHRITQHALLRGPGTRSRTTGMPPSSTIRRLTATLLGTAI
mmetsp:Transcript_36989/g.82229  ORF Transcript_36989/g.82229 Transcript_36989/m.82229 type:complete len:388 (+) Transcript_36989:795-1958(+)